MSSSLPFSSSREAGEFVFVSGKIGVDPKSGRVVSSSAAEQTAQIMSNLEAELAPYGLSLDDAVKMTVFLTDMKYFEEMNAVYRSWFPSRLPARSCVAVVSLPHADALVEIECIAWKRVV